jgi:hypothetical protein
MACTVLVVDSILKPDLQVPSMVLEDPAALALNQCEPSMLVAGIDADGIDAVFNRHQRERLLDEMRGVAGSIKDDDARRNLLEVAAFIEAQWPPSRYGAYILFLAD